MDLTEEQREQLEQLQRLQDLAEGVVIEGVPEGYAPDPDPVETVDEVAPDPDPVEIKLRTPVVFTDWAGKEFNGWISGPQRTMTELAADVATRGYNIRYVVTDGDSSAIHLARGVYPAEGPGSFRVR